MIVNDFTNTSQNEVLLSKIDALMKAIETLPAPIATAAKPNVDLRKNTNSKKAFAEACKRDIEKRWSLKYPSF